MAAASPTTGRWLYGPKIDVLLGCGLGYGLVLLWDLVAGRGALGPRPIPVIALLALFINTPHYGATLLRVYEHREDRRKYAVFAIHATILIGVAFVAGAHSVLLGSLLFTVYVSWSPWHFAGQNYGLALMFLRRRGVAITPWAKRLIYASFLLSFALAFLALHSDTAGWFALLPAERSQSVYRFLPLGIPRSVVDVAFPVVALVYGIAIVGAAVLLLRSARWRDLAPSALLVATQATWFSVPALLSTGVAGRAQYLAFATVWLAVAHSIQYLWVTSYYARQSNPSEHLPGYFGKTLLAGTLITTLPALALAPRVLGAPPYDVGLALLLFSVVNIHHFVLDGAVWKLRDGHMARVLLRNAQTASGGPGDAIGPERRPWARGLVWATGTACLAIALIGIWSKADYREALKKGDLPQLESSVRRLGWIGRDNAHMRLNLGRQLVALRSDRKAGRVEVERSIALGPSADGWTTLGWLHATDGEWQEALAAYEAALELDPNHSQALLHSSAALLSLGQPARAREALARAVIILPEDPRLRRALEEIERVTGEQEPLADRQPETRDGGRGRTLLDPPMAAYGATPRGAGSPRSSRSSVAISACSLLAGH